MSFNVPMSIDILGVVLLDARDFNLLETPLWQVDSSGTKIATQNGVP